MRLSEETLLYLKGSKYSNALTLEFEADEEDYSYRTQIELLCELAAKKRVVHVGCVDHNIDTVNHKIKRKKWLHSRLCASAQRCHGIDIDSTGIQYIREKLGYNDTSCTDIFSDQFLELAQGDDWDHLFIPEVLEHIDDPVGFLRSIGTRYSSCFKNIVLTVPNALSQDNFKAAKSGKEIINSDHRFWFTPYTIARCLYSAGLRVEKILMCRHGSINWRALKRNRFYRKHPILRNDILVIAEFQ